MSRNGLRQIRLLLAGSLGLLLAGASLAAPAAKPLQEDFSSYSLYIQALVDYQRALDAPPPEKPRESADASKLCQDGGSDSDKKKNSCEGKYLQVKDYLPDNASRQAKPASVEAPPAQTHESLEEAISQAGYETAQQTTGNGVPSFAPRGFPLQEISAQDLSEAGVDGLLGLFDNVRMTNLGNGAAPGGSYGGGVSVSGTISIDPDGTQRATLDDFILQLSTIDVAQLASTVSFGDGYSIVDATVRTSGNGLSVGLSSQTYTPVYIVDRDGMPGTEWDGAGALTIDRLAILVPYVEANIQSVRGTTQDNSTLRIDTYSPGPITVGLQNTRIGVAPASRDAKWIGESTSIIEFGPQSVLTIDAGTRVSVSLGQAAGKNTAFVTLNGRVGDISLEDIRLVDHPSTGGLRIGRFAMGGINLVDTKIFADEQKIIVDVGRGLTNVSVDIERVFLGSERAGSFIGDFYARGGRVNELRFTAEPH